MDLRKITDRLEPGEALDWNRRLFEQLKDVKNL